MNFISLVGPEAGREATAKREVLERPRSVGRIRSDAGDPRSRPCCRVPVSASALSVSTVTASRRCSMAIAGLTGWQRGSIKLNGIEVGRTRSQGPGRYTHQIVRAGLALIPQGDEIFHGLTVEEHLDSGAFTARAWRERAERKQRILQDIPAVEKTDGCSGRPTVGRRTAYGLDRSRSDGAMLRCISSTSRRSALPRRSARA